MQLRGRRAAHAFAADFGQAGLVLLGCRVRRDGPDLVVCHLRAQAWCVTPARRSVSAKSQARVDRCNRRRRRNSTLAVMH